MNMMDLNINVVKNKLKKLWNSLAIVSMWDTFLKDDSDRVLTDRGIEILEARRRVLVNGEELIGRARERWEEIDHEGLDWKSFLNGWLEGRLDLIENREKWMRY